MDLQAQAQGQGTTASFHLHGMSCDVEVRTVLEEDAVGSSPEESRKQQGWPPQT